MHIDSFLLFLCHFFGGFVLLETDQFSSNSQILVMYSFFVFFFFHPEYLNEAQLSTIYLSSLILKQLSSLYVLFFLLTSLTSPFTCEERDMQRFRKWNGRPFQKWCEYGWLLLLQSHFSAKYSCIMMCYVWVWHLKEFIQACRSKPMANESDSLGYCGQGRVTFFRAPDKWTLIGK